MAKQELQNLIDYALSNGLEIGERTKKGHIKITREGRLVAVLPRNLGDTRSHKNSMAVLRRAVRAHA